MADALVSLRSLLDGTMVIDVRGELDIAVNDSLRDVLVHTITTLRPPCVVVNLRHVSFVDSTGISALLAGYNAAREVGIRYEVRHGTVRGETAARHWHLRPRLTAILRSWGRVSAATPCPKPAATALSANYLVGEAAPDARAAGSEPGTSASGR
jgi:anti-sigma B factor antagonist